jgi:hypothetical protein
MPASLRLSRKRARAEAGLAFAAVTIALATAGAASHGCGPSLRRVEQANEYFERCYAADRDARRTDDERRACWLAWSEHYRIGQPEDRLDYVRERLVMLDPVHASAIALATGGDDDELAAAEAVDAPPPEGPGVRDVASPAPSVRARRRPIAPRTRASACAAGCEPDFVACASACRVADRGCTDACRHRFRQCARGCF